VKPRTSTCITAIAADREYAQIYRLCVDFGRLLHRTGVAPNGGSRVRRSSGSAPTRQNGGLYPPARTQARAVAVIVGGGVSIA